MKKRHYCETYDEGICDKRVWEKLRENNIKALKTLFVRHHTHLYDYGIKLTRDRFLVEDCIHNLFFKIWDRRQHLNEVHSVKSYLWISFRRDLIKSLNSNKMEMLTDTIKSFSPDIRFNSEELIIQKEREMECGAALEKALNQLPDRQKEAIYLKFFNGMGYDEIQQIMSINYQTARNYVSGGVDTLKQHFSDNKKELIAHNF